MPARSKTAAAVAALLAAALPAAATTPAWAQAADLFSPAGPADLLAPSARPIEGATREALLTLNAGALSSGGPVRLRLFPGVDAAFAPTGASDAFGGGSVWTGASADGSATLVLADGGVVGLATFGGKSFKIERVRGRLHRAAEISPDAFPSESPLLPAPNGIGEAPTPEAFAQPEAGETEIKVLAAYTPAAAASSTAGVASDINLAVSLANQAYAAANAQIKLTLVGTIAVQNYNEMSAPYGQVLRDVTDNAAAFAPVNRARETLKADLVSVIQNNGQSCGLAWYTANPSASTSGFGYSTVTRACIVQHSFSHELGHNMGLNHDRYVHARETGAVAPPSQYNFGFSRPSARKRSIMSYGDECILTAGVSCVRINAFSDPLKTVGGKPFGVKQGKPKAADNARRLRETRIGVAAYR